ncbi:MAG: hypothetical protein FD165_2187 [Gammaproteobacteria bacterium]|nr:MAG: hypothetical protein FD165_2187 [Gammaproteobacteria bacterium]TND05346.1 MAG: hypothetical protein FD120_1221 [Gammaproteobacteria bacterium]
MIDEHIAIFNKSIIVVAHPDDEILWLSSAVNKVDKVVFCFEDCADAPELGPGRRKAVSEYPLPNVSSLGIAESLSFNMADWKNPVETPYGIGITKSRAVNARYRKNYSRLENSLLPILENYDNVFTHNPWGEYGHEDHVQVFRTVETLQRKMNFNLWFSNYCGNRSVDLMLHRVSGFSSDYITLPTNGALASELHNLYKKNKCWTWYDDYQWFNEESFIKNHAGQSAGKSYGHIFPLNFIKTNFSEPGGPNITKRIAQTLRRKIPSFRR